MQTASYGLYYTRLRCIVDFYATPFETQMLRDAHTFVGRWSELQLLVNAIDQRRPAVVCAPPRSGRSSLLFHAVAAGSVLLDIDELPAFYLDMAEFPDLDAVQTTIAEAFAPAGTAWAQAILRAKSAPLIAFDNIDAPQFRAVRATWMQFLAEEVHAGRLRVIAAATSGFVGGGDWVHIPLAPVGQAFLSEYLDVTLPEGPQLSRQDQHFVVAASRGHLGTMIVVLSLWFRSLTEPDVDWRAVALQHTNALSEAAGTPIPPSTEGAEGAPGTTGGEHSLPRARAVESVTPTDPSELVGISGWLVLGAFVVMLIVLYWRAMP